MGGKRTFVTPIKVHGDDLCFLVMGPSSKVGGGWRLAVGGDWRRLVVGWRLVAVGGGWPLAWRLGVLGAVLKGSPSQEEKKSGFLKTALARCGCAKNEWHTRSCKAESAVSPTTSQCTTKPQGETPAE